MARGGVERRVDGIIRWLERFQSSYRSGALENALMDAECARADIENLRLDIWSRVGTVRVPRRASCRGLMSCAVAALTILLATAVPLSTDPVVSLTASETPVAETHKAPEAAEPIAKARKENVALKRAVQAKKSGAKRAAASVPGTGAEAKSAKNEVKKKVVPYDKMFSLLQMGERALKNEESVIKVHGTGKGEGKL